MRITNGHMHVIISSGGTEKLATRVRIGSIAKSHVQCHSWKSNDMDSIKEVGPGANHDHGHSSAEGS